jgi:hypothetical protein
MTFAAEQDLPRNDIVGSPRNDIVGPVQIADPCPRCGKPTTTIRATGKKPYRRCPACHGKTPRDQAVVAALPLWAQMLQDERDYTTRIMWHCLLELKSLDPLSLRRHALTLYRIAGEPAGDNVHRRLYDVLHAYSWHVERGGAPLDRAAPPWKMTVDAGTVIAPRT